MAPYSTQLSFGSIFKLTTVSLLACSSVQASELAPDVESTTTKTVYTTVTVPIQASTTIEVTKTIDPIIPPTGIPVSTVPAPIPGSTDTNQITTPPTTPSDPDTGSTNADDGIRNGTLHIVDDDPDYKYVGCWTDTTEFPGQHHALSGPNINMATAMTVPRCINYCKTANNPGKGSKGIGWPIAAIEYAKECYCGTSLSTKSYHLLDSVCDTACAGSNTTVCGGNLALSVYNVTEKTPTDNGNGNGGATNSTDGNGGFSQGDPDAPKDEAVLQAVGMGVLVLALTVAVGAGFF